MAFDLITIGDVVIDTFVPLQDAEVEIKKGEKMLTMRFGDKIPVGESISIVAGNSANSAVGGARLKMKSAAYTNIGHDTDDDSRILTKFKKEGVDTRYIVKNSDHPSNHHVVLTFKGERTILIYHQPWKYHLPDFDLSKWIYFTSLAPSFVDTDIISGLSGYLERTAAKLLYNPGTFQIKHGVKRYPRLLSLTELFIVNKEEANLILGYQEGDKTPIKKLLLGIADLGPKLVVVTDGGNGSYGFDGEKFYKLGIFPAKLVEITGSGDAYATGTMAGLFYGKSLDEAMRWGAANAASVVEHIGAQEGLLTYGGMIERLKGNPKVVAKEI